MLYSERSINILLVVLFIITHCKKFSFQLLPDLEFYFGVAQLLMLIHCILKANGDALTERCEHIALGGRFGHNAQFYQAWQVKIVLVERERDQVAKGDEEALPLLGEIIG